MKLPSALIAAVLAGAATFVGQQEIQASPRSAQLGPAQSGPAQSGPLGGQGDPAGRDWRQLMIARGSAVSVDQAVANLTKNLDLTPGQVARIKPILEAHHDRIRNLLEAAPATLTHEEFMTQVHQISAETHGQVNALLTGRQRAVVKQLRTPARI
jgi:hypothetical protein